MSSSDVPMWREGITDEAISNQMNEISAQVNSAQPLVGEKEGLECLYLEYDDNDAFLPKVADLSQKYKAVRRMRGDGNCFYRSLLVALGEAFVGAHVVAPGQARPVIPTGEVVAGMPMYGPAPESPLQQVYQRMLTTVAGSLDTIVASGHLKETTEDFHRVFSEWLVGLGTSYATVEASALAPLRGEYSFYAIYFTRLLTSLEIKRNPDEYFPFILGTTDCLTVEEFCNSQVETASSDADMVQMKALCTALGVAVRVAYLDATPGDAVYTVQLPEGVPADTLTLDLLYRPGHYDVVYS